MELWKDIKGYEDLYQVSSKGRVRALPRQGFTIHGKRDHIHYLKPDITYHNKDEYRVGYCRVTLCKEGIYKRYMVHRLVAQAFIPNPENKPYINHIDCDGMHNWVENLEWVTHSENMLWCHKLNRCSNLKASYQSSINCKEEAINFGKTFYGTAFIGIDKSRHNNRIKAYCAECGTIFSRRMDLIRTMPNPYICRKCSYKYRTRKHKDIV